jgi:hypothetical protein
MASDMGGSTGVATKSSAIAYGTALRIGSSYFIFREKKK